MKMTPLLGVLGVALCVGCGGAEGDGGGSKDAGPSAATVQKTGQHDGTADLTAQVSKSGQHDGTAERPAYVTKVGQPDGVNERQGYEYLLHGTDLELDAWLSPTDVVLERSPAGDLTYARVLTTDVRHVPATLQP